MSEIKFYLLTYSKITPTYFTDLLVKSFLPHNFSFKSVSKTLPLRLTIKTSVFVMLREILLAFSHFERDLRFYSHIC